MKEKMQQDAISNRIRFGCGGLFGALLGTYMFIGEFFGNIQVTVVILAIFIVLFGYLAMHYGDRFWDKVIDSFRWWV